jgi:inner membrane protein
MATAFAHVVAATAIGSACGYRSQAWRIVLIGLASSVLPDLDSIGYLLGIPYEHPLGHRGLSHSVPFAAVWSSAVVALWFRHEAGHERRRLWLFFFLATASHGVLDAMTDGGLGVAFFAPLSNERYFFPFRPLVVPPLEPNKFFSLRALPILKSEFVWVWIPSLCLIGVILWRRRGSSIGGKIAQR